MKIRTGFISYLSTGEYTPDFIEDVNVLVSNVFNEWSLYEDLEEFTSSCWAKIAKSLQIYDLSGCHGRTPASLYTYLSSVVWNEARRIYSKHKRMVCDDVADFPDPDYAWAVEPSKGREDLFLRDRLCSFARRAYDLGVYVDQEGLLKNYLLGNITPAVKTFMWDAILSA